LIQRPNLHIADARRRAPPRVTARHRAPARADARVLSERA